MKTNKWKIARINSWVSMTRVCGKNIEVRPLTWWEKIVYFWYKPVKSIK